MRIIVFGVFLIWIGIYKWDETGSEKTVFENSNNNEIRIIISANSSNGGSGDGGEFKLKDTNYDGANGEIYYDIDDIATNIAYVYNGLTYIERSTASDSSVTNEYLFYTKHFYHADITGESTTIDQFTQVNTMGDLIKTDTNDRTVYYETYKVIEDEQKITIKFNIGQSDQNSQLIKYSLTNSYFLKQKDDNDEERYYIILMLMKVAEQPFGNHRPQLLQLQCLILRRRKRHDFI